MKQNSTLFSHVCALGLAALEKVKGKRLHQLSCLLVATMSLISTGANAQYCSPPMPSNPQSLDISEVSLGSMTNASSCNTAASGTGSVAGMYSNFVGVSGVTVPTLLPATSYTLTVKAGDCAGYCGNCYYGQIYAYIDFNKDGDWSDAGEQVMTTSTFAGAPSHTSQTATFTTPTLYTAAGVSRMRVVYWWSGTVSSACAGGSYTFGETEDYSVNLLNNCSGMPTAGTAINKTGVIFCTGKPTLDLPSTAYAAGMQYRWQSRKVGTTAWINESAVLTLPEYTVTTAINVDRQYRAWARCISSNLTDTSQPVTVVVNGTKITPSDTAALCTPTNNQPLKISAPSLSDTAFRADFENGSTGWTFSSTYSGWSWGVQSSPYNWSWWAVNGINSPGSSKFLFLSPNNYAYASSFSSAISPSFSTVGYSSATLTFQHWLHFASTPPTPQTVDISTDGGSTWTTLGSYTGSQGSQSNFTLVTISLTGYLNQPDVKLRFREQEYYPNAWGIDNINIVGAHPPLTYAWSATPSTGAGLPTGAGTPSASNDSIMVTPSAGQYLYTATLTGQGSGCPSTRTVLLKVGPKPISTISGNNVICNADSTALTVNITGTAPYQVIYSDGTTPVTINNVNTNTLNINVAPNSSRIYKVIGLATSICTATTAQMTDSAIITVNQRPTSSMNNGSMVSCDAATAYIPVTFTGTPPYNITFTDGSTTYTQSNITTNNYQMPVTTLPGTHIYTITGITDANGCIAKPSDRTGNFTVTSQVRPTGVISGSATLCNGTLGTLQVTFTGTAPYSLGYTDGGSFVYSVNNIYSNPYTLTVAPTTTSVYTLDHVTDANCTTLPQDVSGSSTVMVNNRPTSNLSGVGQTLCEGNQVNLSIAFTGVPPYNFGYSNGTTSTLVSGIYSSTYNFTVTPVASGNYIVTGLNDAFCTAQLPDMTGAVPITVRSPEASISGTRVTCAGDQNALLVDFSGAGLTAPYTFMYTNGTSNQVVTTSSDPYPLSVTATSDATYTLLSFTDANCPGDVSGSAVLTVNAPGGWKGMVSSDWNNPVNWCGLIPTATTDVKIPGTSPNMPVLASGAGYCDTMTVMPGASVTVNAGANLDIHGDVYNGGSLNWATGNINFKGVVPQYVSGFTAHNLFIGNDAGVIPTSDAEVASLMVLDGNVFLNNASLTMKPGALIIGDDYYKYVHTQGTGTLNMNVSAGPAKFPVGNATYNPVTLNNTGVPDRFSVRVVDAVYADGYGTNPATVNFPVVNRTWMISEQTAGGSVVTVRPQWNGMTGEEINFFDRAHSFVRHWNGTTWSYQDSVNAGPAQGIDPYYTSAGGYTNFSPFTVGGWSLYPLAIDLLEFDAQLQGKDDALLKWSISQSSEAQSFNVERSEDGVAFSKIGEVAAVAEKTNYTTTDKGLSPGRHYYRLQAIDAAGKTGYSNVAVVAAKGMGVELISLAPNPVTGVGTVTISSDNATNADVRIMDAVGRVLYTGSHNLVQGMNKLALDMNSLPQGNYTLHVITNTGNATPVKFTKM